MNDAADDPPNDEAPAPPEAEPAASAKPAKARAFGRSPNGARAAPRRKKGWRPGLWAPIAAAVVVALAGAGVWGWLAVQDFLAGVPAIPPRDQLVVVNQAPAMTFEDMTGQVIATRGPKHGQAVSLAELPPYVPEAFLAAEDRRFYQHGAVDLRGIARAAWSTSAPTARCRAARP